ncbi:MAG TPA: Vms1/Ankzf1 family peptidyl-tRNA hydrolase, partial [Actinomycetota bacterium]|nr:Vms1/Ankzf1 family peptidyl-tRNA hydrolase [Actinomycetota bacterium]
SPDRALVRGLASWDPDGAPVTTLYLDTDGRRYPRRSTYLSRAEDLLRSAKERARELDRPGWDSACGDVARIRTYLRDEYDRRGTRGVAVFSSSSAGLWSAVPLPQPVRDRASLGPRPDVVPLEALVELAETSCVAIVDREKARILVTTLGEIDEVTDILDEVPGQHDQGGWAQRRLQRHIEDHVLRHLKRVGDSLLRLHQRRRFDHLLLAGPDEVVHELERELHDYVRRAVAGRLPVAMSASPAEVRDRVMDFERDREARREREAVERVVGEVGAGTGRAVGGLAETLDALERGRVETLVVAADLRAEGVRCPSCGHVAVDGPRCSACGSPTEPTDAVEEAVEMALRQRCRVETVAGGSDLAALGGIGALLRF